MCHTEDSFDRLFGQSRIHAGCFRLIGPPVVGSSSCHLPLALCPCKILDDAEFCRVLWFVYRFDVVPSNLQISLFVFLFGVGAKIRELKNCGWALHQGLERRKRLVGWKKGEVWTLMSLTKLKTEVTLAWTYRAGGAIMSDSDTPTILAPTTHFPKETRKTKSLYPNIWVLLTTGTRQLRLPSQRRTMARRMNCRHNLTEVFQLFGITPIGE